ncbi:hypothetical protein J6590_029324 [Homalodisca vitripennis]|nr:hypothetical protein J6590_029324 [Homalodisca vitripennis]
MIKQNNDHRETHDIRKKGQMTRAGSLSQEGRYVFLKSRLQCTCLVPRPFLSPIFHGLKDITLAKQCNNSYLLIGREHLSYD